jgi:hypothetical protein
MATIILTAEDSGPIHLKTSEIERIRRMTDSERDAHDATTRIDYAHTVYAKEQPENVALLVAANGVPTLGRLLLPNGWPVWFDARKARGPLPVPHSAPQDSIHSALEIGGKLQYVRSTPQEVHDLIETAQGNVLPIPRAIGERGARSAQELQAPRDIWDADVPELMGRPTS